jgi:hypothetical protein
MNLRPRATRPPIRLLLCATAVLTFIVSGVAGPAVATSDSQVGRSDTSTAPTTKPRLIVYAGRHSPGVEVRSRADAKDLTGAPRSFKRFIGRTAHRIVHESTCSGGYVGVTVGRLRTDGYAVGGVNDCGGYAAMWATVNGRWKEIQGTQDIWDCAILKRHRVPSSVAGRTCYDYEAQRTRHYHQR